MMDKPVQEQQDLDKGLKRSAGKLASCVSQGEEDSNTLLLPNKQEKQYHSNLHMLLQGLGFLGGRKMQMYSESPSSKGRSDIVLDLESAIYIIEIKYKSTGKIALEQIKTNGYYKPYLLRQKTIILLGINFNEETRMIDSWDYEIHEEHLEE